MAKEHVERDYAVVGTWEETNITLTVFEKYIPRFFEGAKLLFDREFYISFVKWNFKWNINFSLFILVNNEQITNRNKNRRKPKIDQDVKDMIRQNFTQEYDFYYFCKQRLYKQYLAISLKELEKHNLLD